MLRANATVVRRLTAAARIETRPIEGERVVAHRDDDGVRVTAVVAQIEPLGRWYSPSCHAATLEHRCA